MTRRAPYIGYRQFWVKRCVGRAEIGLWKVSRAEIFYATLLTSTTQVEVGRPRGELEAARSDQAEAHRQSCLLSSASRSGKQDRKPLPPALEALAPMASDLLRQPLESLAPDLRRSSLDSSRGDPPRAHGRHRQNRRLRIDAGVGREHARIGHVQPVDRVVAKVRPDHARRRVAAHPTRAE